MIHYGVTNGLAYQCVLILDFNIDDSSLLVKINLDITPCTNSYLILQSCHAVRIELAVAGILTSVLEFLYLVLYPIIRFKPYNGFLVLYKIIIVVRVN